MSRDNNQVGMEYEKETREDSRPSGLLKLLLPGVALDLDCLLGTTLLVVEMRGIIQGRRLRTLAVVETVPATNLQMVVDLLAPKLSSLRSFPSIDWKEIR